MKELFAHIFGIYIKFGYKNPSILTPSNSVDVATKLEKVFSYKSLPNFPHCNWKYHISACME